MDTKKPTDGGEQERLLSRYSAADRRLIENVMAQHPQLTVAEAIAALEAGGGL